MSVLTEMIQSIIYVNIVFSLQIKVDERINMNVGKTSHMKFKHLAKKTQHHYLQTKKT